VATCLVTGNLEPIGWTKMDALGLKDYFYQPRFGGFGSDVCSGNHVQSWKDRAEMVKIALAKLEAFAPGT
jgi:phosphoglycolate phosphatase